MTPEEMEELKTTDPERWQALRQPQLDQELSAAAKRRAEPLYSSEHDPGRPTPYERRARAERDACRAAGEPEPPVYGSSGGW